MESETMGYRYDVTLSLEVTLSRRIEDDPDAEAIIRDHIEEAMRSAPQIAGSVSFAFSENVAL